MTTRRDIVAIAEHPKVVSHCCAREDMRQLASLYEDLLKVLTVKCRKTRCGEMTRTR